MMLIEVKELPGAARVNIFDATAYPGDGLYVGEWADVAGTRWWAVMAMVDGILTGGGVQPGGGPWSVAGDRDASPSGAGGVSEDMLLKAIAVAQRPELAFGGEG